MATSTEIKSKTELASLASQLETLKSTLKSEGDNLKSKLSNITNYDGIDVSGPGNVLASNLDNILADLEAVSGNIKNYSLSVINFDVDDFNSVENYLDGVTGTAVTLPGGLGSVHSYMGWQCITATSSNQYKLREAAGMNFDNEGFARIGDRYVVATTTTFGNVGDYIDVVQSDGTVIKCIIGDIKNQNDAGCNKWGHNNGQCVVEFVVDRSSWYGTNKTVAGYHPEWNQNISQIINKGNYFNLSGKYNTSASSSSSANSSSGSQKYNWSTGTTAAAATPLVYYSSNSSNKGSYTYSVGTSSSNNYSSGSSYSGGSYGSSGPITTTPVTIKSGDPNIDVSKYHNNLEKGFEVTVGNLAYEVSDADYELLCAIVSAESDKSYDDALAVITTILNRCEAPNWIRSHGTNPVAQATAPNQFVVYQHGSYKAYMGGRAPETVQTAVRDALAGVRNHHYLSFRSNGSTGYSDNRITSTGNRYK